jgi:hypothetical protein
LLFQPGATISVNMGWALQGCHKQIAGTNDDHGDLGLYILVEIGCGFPDP